MTQPRGQWNLKHLASLIAVLAVGFGLLGVSATILLGILLSPMILAPRGRRRSGFYWIVTFYPIFLLIGLYFTWSVAWVVLGHRPRCNLDDPKDINPIEGPYVLTAYLVLAAPTAFLIGCGLTMSRVVRPSRAELHWFVRSYPLFLYPIVWSVGYGLLAWDPLRVLERFFD
jgi:hypothetical protein